MRANLLLHTIRTLHRTPGFTLKHHHIMLTQQGRWKPDIAIYSVQTVYTKINGRYIFWSISVTGHQIVTIKETRCNTCGNPLNCLEPSAARRTLSSHLVSRTDQNRHSDSTHSQSWRLEVNERWWWLCIDCFVRAEILQILCNGCHVRSPFLSQVDMSETQLWNKFSSEINRDTPAGGKERRHKYRGGERGGWSPSKAVTLTVQEVWFPLRQIFSCQGF